MRDNPFTNGMCTQVELDCGNPGSAADCPAGTTCRKVDAANATTLYTADLCLPNCTTDGECRVADGYRCCPRRIAYAGPDGNVCTPAASGCLP